jgi:N-acetylneuraminate epimerase
MLSLRVFSLFASIALPSFAAPGADPLHSSKSSPTLVWKSLPSLPDPEGFASAFAGVSNGALIFAGGANFPEKRPWEGGSKVWSDRIFVLENPASTWLDAGALPRPNAYGVSCSIPEGIVCVGGGNASEHFTDAFLLTWNGHQVSTRNLPPLPARSAFGSGVSVGSQVYLFGGLSKPDATTASADLFTLDVASPTPTWKRLPPYPGGGRMLAQIGVVGETLYVCGGVSLRAGPDGKAIRSYMRDTYAYEPARGWKKRADLPHEVAAAPSPLPVSPAGELLVISGDDGKRTSLIGPNHPGFLQEILVYDTARDTWSKIADGPISRATAPTTLWRGEWIIANGERKPAYRSPEIWSVQFAP